MPSALRLSGFLDHLIVLGLCAMLIFGPLAFGAVEWWSIFVLQAAASLLFLAWAGRQILLPQLLEIAPNPLHLPMILFAALILTQVVFGLTAYHYVTFAEAMKYVVYGVVLFLVAQCVRSERHLQWMLTALTVLGFLLAVFAIIQDLTYNGKLYWVRQPSPGGEGFYGPYVNRNHYAGVMELLTSIPLVLSMSGLVTGAKRVLLAFLAIVMGASIFLSMSRGGMLSFLAQLLFAGVFLLSRRAGMRRAAAYGALFLLILLFLSYVGGDRVLERVATLRDPLGTGVYGKRWMILQDSLRMFTDAPILGWGLGVFRFVYPQHRSFYSNRVVNEAHNDYLQVLVETGILGFAAMTMFLILLYRHGFRNLLRGSMNLNRAATLAALTGCTGILVHSLSDFNLHIPANAALFYAFCGLVTRPAELKDTREPPVPAPADG